MTAFSDLVALAQSIPNQSSLVAGYALFVAAVMLARLCWQGRKDADQAIKMRLGSLADRHRMLVTSIELATTR